MKKLLIVFVAVVLLAMPLLTMAGTVKSEITGPLSTIGQTGFDEPSGSGVTLPDRIGRIIKIVLGLLGIVLIVIVIYAGFLWMTAGGNEDQVKKARQWLINAIIGLAIILSAYAITDFIITKLISATTGTDSIY